MTKAGDNITRRAEFFFLCRKKIGANFLAKNPEIFSLGFENKSISENAKQLLLVFFQFANERKISDIYPANKREIKIWKTSVQRALLMMLLSNLTSKVYSPMDKELTCHTGSQCLNIDMTKDFISPILSGTPTHHMHSHSHNAYCYVLQHEYLSLER